MMIMMTNDNDRSDGDGDDDDDDDHFGTGLSKGVIDIREMSQINQCSSKVTVTTSARDVKL